MPRTTIPRTCSSGDSVDRSSGCGWATAAASAPHAMPAYARSPAICSPSSIRTTSGCPVQLDAELRVLERYPVAEVIVSDSMFLFEGRFRPKSRFEENGAFAATQGKCGWLENAPWLWTVPSNAVSTCAITLRRHVVARLGDPLFAEDLNVCEDWELEVRLYQECRVVALPEVWSPCAAGSTMAPESGRASPGKPSTPGAVHRLPAQSTHGDGKIHPAGQTHAGPGHCAGARSASQRPGTGAARGDSGLTGRFSPKTRVVS